MKLFLGCGEAVNTVEFDSTIFTQVRILPAQLKMSVGNQ